MTSGQSRGSSKHVLSLIRRDAEHSTLYHWMVQHHDDMVAAGHETRFRWDALCVAFIDLGLKDCRGSNPRPSTARQTWLRVRQAVERRRQQKPPSPVQPNQVEAPPMRSSVPMNARVPPVAAPMAVPVVPSFVPADRPVASSVPSWMPVEHPPTQRLALVPGDQRTGLNRMGETPEEAALRVNENVDSLNRIVAEASGQIPPRKV